MILCHGGNDILKGLSLAKLENNLAQMIELIQSYEAEIILIGVPKPSLRLSTLPLYKNLANNYSLVADLTSLSELLSQGKMESDTVHLNEQGYQKLAEIIADKIELL